jgi:D-sedoheptulose 7-phosphate isomerase
MGMMDPIDRHFRGNIEVISKVCEEQADAIRRVADLIVERLTGGGKLLLMGNGGSAADAQHFAAELVGRFRRQRKALPAIALTTDTSILTAVSNDYGFEEVFQRQVEALAQSGDVVCGISTSGNSPNVLRALEKARSLGCATLSLTGRGGGLIAAITDQGIVVPAEEVPFIQEAHLVIIHILCGLIEDALLSGESS